MGSTQRHDRLSEFEMQKQSEAFSKGLVPIIRGSISIYFRQISASVMKPVILTAAAFILIAGKGILADDTPKKIGDCDCKGVKCQGIVFFDAASNLNKESEGLVIQPTQEKCRDFCKTDASYKDKAKYFAWIDSSFSDAKYHNSCWCKNDTSVAGQKRQGVTTSKIDGCGMSALQGRANTDSYMFEFSLLTVAH